MCLSTRQFDKQKPPRNGEEKGKKEEMMVERSGREQKGHGDGREAKGSKAWRKDRRNELVRSRGQQRTQSGKEQKGR